MSSLFTSIFQLRYILSFTFLTVYIWIRNILYYHVNIRIKITTTITRKHKRSLPGIHCFQNYVSMFWMQKPTDICPFYFASCSILPDTNNIVLMVRYELRSYEVSWNWRCGLWLHWYINSLNNTNIRICTYVISIYT